MYNQITQAPEIKKALPSLFGRQASILKIIPLLVLLCTLLVFITVSARDNNTSSAANPISIQNSHNYLPPELKPVPYPEETIDAAACREMGEKISRLVSKYHLSKAKIGIKAVSLNDNKVICDKNSGTPLMPASNLKVFTTGAALCLLGPDFKYETTLYRQGPVIDGALKGNLIVKSNGNPNISGRFYNGNSTAVFEEWVKILKKLGINRVEGNIIIDDTAFDREYLVCSWPENQLSAWYCAPVGGVSFNDNCIDITVYYNDKKDEVSYRLEPNTDYVTIINDCSSTTRSSNHAVSLRRKESTNTIVISGRFYIHAEPYKESITIENPPLYFGTVLKETFSRKKSIPVLGEIKLTDKTYNRKSDHLTELASSKTDLLTTITVTNKNSQNFYAEQILKTLGSYFRSSGSFKGGAAQIEKFLLGQKIVTSTKTYEQVDGSGLSRGNKITPDAMVKLLRYIASQKYGKDFIETLPANGDDGSLKNRINGKGLAKTVWAKTGYISGVSALSGYITNHKNYAFSIIINNFSDLSNARKFQDEVVKLLLKD
ncbi:MAG: D-alanyl-D-alanine carboxypeptidase/D-alanyl-D-alanine-endopeptidase [Planctomycetes bacterium]|nr:D-alanyl-D-alanine carboxypeptidase/D-alanyl-D-alanine-endopeptidase [Planctomycetota bacterium]